MSRNFTMFATLLAPASLLTAGLVLLAPGTARAGIDACANVYVAAEASCEWVPAGETCTTQCAPTTVQTSCAARLYTACASQCTASAEVTCTASCAESCVPSCVDVQEQQPPNCMGLCMSDCQMDCNDACAGAEDQGACRSSCAHTCSESCADQCDGSDEQTCDPVCGLACAGSCTAEANMNCQVSCQAESFTQCETEVVNECHTDCEQHGGALFCDGSYVAHASAVEDCIAALQAELDIEVKGWAEGECHGLSGAKKIECEAEAGLSCDVTRGTGGGGLAILALAGLIGIPALRRRRRAR